MSGPDGHTLFGTREPLFRHRLAQAGIEVGVPEPADPDRWNEVTYQELGGGRILPVSHSVSLEIIDGLELRLA